MRISITNDDQDGKTLRVRALDSSGKDIYAPSALEGGDTVSFSIGKGEHLDVRESEDR